MTVPAIPVATILALLCSAGLLKAQNPHEASVEDSVVCVADRLMSYDVYINSFEISDAELDWVESEHPDWVVKYFPGILTRYDCTLYSKFSLAASLYKKDRPEYLRCLWRKFGYLFYVDGARCGQGGAEVGRVGESLDGLEIDPGVLGER